jgi:hypothetical protein
MNKRRRADLNSVPSALIQKGLLVGWFCAVTSMTFSDLLSCPYMCLSASVDTPPKDGYSPHFLNPRRVSTNDLKGRFTQVFIVRPLTGCRHRQRWSSIQPRTVPGDSGTTQQRKSNVLGVF